MIVLRRGVLAAAIVSIAVVCAVAPASGVSAHTETSFVAVPAGSTAEVGFVAQHGCGESPTVDVRIQAPVEGATAVEKSGWTATATADGAGTTVLQWTGGSLPADQAGTFEVEFTVPDAVGTLLAFPAVQTCENGEEEPWIETEPGAASPAPQLLVLATGSAPAASLDDVALDAPGRDRLAAILSGEATHDDAGAAAATTAGAPAPTATSTAPTTAAAAPATTAIPDATTPDTTTPGTAPVTTVSDDGGDDDGSSGWLVWVVIAAAVIVVGGGISAVVTWRNRNTPPTP